MTVADDDQVTWETRESARITGNNWRVTCLLDPHVTIDLLMECDRWRQRLRDYSWNRTKIVIETVVAIHPLDDRVVKEGYERALKRVYGHRIGANRKRRKKMEKSLDFPRGQET